jgi:hypothetical protein
MRWAKSAIAVGWSPDGVYSLITSKGAKDLVASIA